CIALLVSAGMDATIVLAGVCALAALVALIAVATALFAIRRSSGADAAAIVHQQIPASLESLRLEVRASLDGATQTLGQRIAQLSAEVDRRLADVGGEVGRRLETTTGMIGERLEGAARAVAEVHQRLGTVQGATERVLEVGRDIASLQQILKAPKLRGGLGELFLGELLAQTLPPGGFELQYAFRGGQRVDAIVRIGDHIIPVDAKFPLENFTRIVTAPDDAARAAARKSFVN